MRVTSQFQSQSQHRGPRHRGGDGRRVVGIVAVVFVALVVIGWFVASPIAKSIANRKLAAMPGFTGHVDAVKISLWRPSVTVNGFMLFTRGKENDPPLVRARHAKLALSYKALLRGKIVGQAEVAAAESTVVKEPPPGEAAADDKKDSKAKKEGKAQQAEEKKEKVERWQEALAKTFPVEITTLEVKDTSIRFIDRSRQPVVDLAMANVHLIGTGLGNRPQKDAGPLPAKINLTATTTGNGKLAVAVQADPLAKQPRFRATLELRELSLPALNNFLLAYANADVARGTFEFYLEVEAENGGYQGYVKPFFKDLDFKTASDKDKSVGQLLVKKTVAAVTSVLKNKEEEKVATKAPFSGNFADNQVDIWTTIQNLLRNAFLQGLREGFEGQTPSK